MKKSAKRILIGIGIASVAVAGTLIAKQAKKVLDLLTRLDLPSILSEQYPEVEHWTFSSVVFPNILATTVYCPAELLTANPDAEEKIKQLCLEKVPELANIKFTLKMKSAKCV